MTTMAQTSTQTYRKYQWLLVKAANKTARRYGIPKDEAMSACHEIYMEALATHDSDKGAFSTHLCTQLLKLSHIANPNSVENQQHKSNLLFSSPCGQRDNGGIETLESKLGMRDSSFEVKDLWDWMDKCSTSDSKELAWQIIFGDINHDATNYELIKDDFMKRTTLGRPKKGDTLMKNTKSKKHLMRFQITAEDCYDQWAKMEGWTMTRVLVAFSDLVYVLNNMKGV